MNLNNNPPGVATLNQHSSAAGEGGGSILNGLRRTFFNFLRHPQGTLLSRKSSLRRQNMTLPRHPISKQGSDSSDDSQIVVAERLVSKTVIGESHHYIARRFSAYAETPEPIRAEYIRLDKLSGGKGEVIPREHRIKDYVHAFCAIPLELDTFCDFCNQPIWGLGWGPVCQRCADCHMTCHWLCKDKVTIPCEASPSTARNADIFDDEEEADAENGLNEDPKSGDEGSRTPTASRPTSTQVLRPQSIPVAKGTRAVSVGVTGDPPTPVATPVLTNADGRRPSAGDGGTAHPEPSLRPASQFSLFSASSGDASLQVNETLEESVEEVEEEDEKTLGADSDSPQSPTEEPKSSPRVQKSTRHQSMLHSNHRKNRRGNRHRRLHTTSVSLSSVGGTAAASLDAYDISSLDQSDILQRGISLWHLSPTVTPGDKADNQNHDGQQEAEPTRVLSSRLQNTQMAALTGQPMPVGAFPEEVITYTKVTVGPRNGALPWKPVDLARRLEIFNANEFGLCAKMTPKLVSGDCEGQVRLHINLIRPVRMLLNNRPPSIFDIVGTNGNDDDDDDEEDEIDENVAGGADQSHIETIGDSALPSNGRVKMRGGRITSFRLPRGSSKLLHVHLSTTASQVIRCLLGRFNIDDNPQKFALYEHTICGENEVSVRKLFDDESPLGLLLQWTLDPRVDVGGKAGEALHKEHFNATLRVKRIVLQENETGDIEWTCFSEAQLRTFLEILNREEADYRERIVQKYRIRKREILRLMALRAKCHQRSLPTPAPSGHDIGLAQTDLDNLVELVQTPTPPPPQSAPPSAVRPSDLALSDTQAAVAPTPIVPQTVAKATDPLSIGTPLSPSQTQLLTRAQQKQRARSKGKKAKKSSSKPLKPTKAENGVAKLKKRLWLQRRPKAGEEKE